MWLLAFRLSSPSRVHCRGVLVAAGSVVPGPFPSLLRLPLLQRWSLLLPPSPLPRSKLKHAGWGTALLPDLKAARASTTNVVLEPSFQTSVET